jgi:hypothetical protein
VQFVAFIADCEDTEVDIGGESAVQQDFGFAVDAATFERGEVEEAEINGLLDLIDEWRCDEDP